MRSVRSVITDAMWDRIEPLIPADPLRGRRRPDHRRTLEAIARKYRTNSPWRDLPDKLGSFKTAHKRLIRWAVDDTWEKILAAVLTVADADDDLDRTVSVDSTLVRAYQPAAGARKKGRPTPASPPITRSDARTPPRGTEHQGPPSHRRPGTTPRLQRHHKPDRSRTRLRDGDVPQPRGPAPAPDPALTAPADRAYPPHPIRNHPRRRGTRPVIPQPSDQAGHPPSFNNDAYKHRNTAEQYINRPKQQRDPTTRTDKPASAPQTALHPTSIPTPTPP